MATTADLRVGAVIRFQGELCVVLESIHRTPGNLRAFYQVKMRVIKSGKLKEERFRSGETIEFVRVETNNFQYLYRDADLFTFMDTNTYDQIPVAADIVGDAARFLKEGTEVQIGRDEEGNVVTMNIPQHVALRVEHTEPGVRGDTATNVLKPATLETGASVSVPLFINEGDMIRVDTATGAYLDRVKE
ncbi:MAG: elongation factor P [Flavobacteriales bacterium]|nr:MAG: elongation factor P [Bacteroidota bacterium]KXK35662.1 MAG: translation elongation factor P [Chlorobi bacterium OLB6]MBE2266374.1 elongation factor P [Flavobacteriales bacterium]MBV6463794.1 Elongation factor P [Chlorobiota bacterium]MBW7853665.1 elongation factor P [Candidatus Kapabacteria bacterium]MCC6332101.1 elongation factor P [Ignavibacteria bacterium]